MYSLPYQTCAVVFSSSKSTATTAIGEVKKSEGLSPRSSTFPAHLHVKEKNKEKKGHKKYHHSLSRVKRSMIKDARY